MENGKRKAENGKRKAELRDVKFNISQLALLNVRT